MYLCVPVYAHVCVCLCVCVCQCVCVQILSTTGHYIVYDMHVTCHTFMGGGHAYRYVCSLEQHRDNRQ